MSPPLPHNTPLSALAAKRVFYGWWIVIGALLLGIIGAGFVSLGATAFFLPLEEEFGASRARLSSVIALGSVLATLSQPVQGLILDRFGPRRMAFASVTLMGTGFFMISTASSLNVFLVYFAFLAAMGSFGLMFSAIVGVGSWFVRRRGLALAIATSGFSLGGLVVIFTNFLIEAIDWRGAAVIMAFIVWGAGYPLASVLRHKPEQYGLRPDGGRLSQTPSTGGAAAADGEESGFLLKEALATRTFWLLAVNQALRMFVVTSVGVHFIPAIVDKGFSPAVGASLLGLFALTAFPSRIGSGVLMDWIPKRIVGNALYLVMSLSLALFAWQGGLAIAILFVVLYGVGWGGAGGGLDVAIRAEYFGRRSFGAIMGFSGVLTAASVFVGPLVTGYIFDTTHTYRAAFFLLSAIAFGASVIILGAKRPAAPLRR